MFEGCEHAIDELLRNCANAGRFAENVRGKQFGG
jgi:hypothetical protein